MNTFDILASMNTEQADAVFSLEGPVLVFAGAGSGKTRVLTYRAAYLIDVKKINPENILAITFTNKAANEMKTRIEALIGPSSNHMWVMTFHSMCARILRKHAYLLNYGNNFTIYDTDDSKALLKKIIKDLSYGDFFSPKDALNFISSLKCKGTKPEDYFAVSTIDQYLKTCYEEYEKLLFENNALDFDDLLLKVYDLFTEFPDVLEQYQKTFRYIMVDEYQDTNGIQFQLIYFLAKAHENLFVVGDDDQSIYSFRGADINNILGFQDIYPDAKIIKLEENYRSTANILNTANAVIKNNDSRASKTLHTKNATGQKIIYTETESANYEAEFVIRDILNGSYDYSDIAILYRTNAQSRLLEEACIRYNVPYRIVGGVNFYQRKEIKDLVAYLKIIANPADSLSIKRIINVPRRSIGQTTIAKIETYAKSNKVSFYQALMKASEIPGISKKTTASITQFINTIESLKYKLSKAGALDISGDGSFSIQEYLNYIVYDMGYLEELEKSVDIEVYTNKKENIEELINKVLEFETLEGTFKLDKLLENIALVSETDEDAETDKITLMTLHASKGLEFKKVYLVGLEDGIFPSSMSLVDNNLEEERRLCYVGITRAIKSLTITSAASRMVNGRYQKSKHSRFIDEMPNKYVEKNFYSYY
jgi:DNA helicase-2/ATP-dependent DNA helicase PcrA